MVPQVLSGIREPGETSLDGSLTCRAYSTAAKTLLTTHLLTDLNKM